MKRLEFTLASAAALLISIGCGAPTAAPLPPPPPPQAIIPMAAAIAQADTAKPNREPAWVNNPKSVPGMVGVGTQKPNALGNIMLQRKLALAQARMDIAGQIKVLAQGLTTLAATDSAAAGGDGGSAAVSETATEAGNDVIRNVINQELAGVTPMEYWTNPESKYIYALVVMDPAAADRYAKVAAEKAIRKEVAMGAKGLNEGLDKLDQEIAKTVVPQ